MERQSCGFDSPAAAAPSTWQLPPTSLCCDLSMCGVLSTKYFAVGNILPAKNPVLGSSLHRFIDSLCFFLQRRRPVGQLATLVFLRILQPLVWYG